MDLLTGCRGGSRIFLQGGGGVNDGRVQRAPTGGSRVDKHQIKVHSVHRIFRAILFVLFFAIVKKFVDKNNGGREQGGGGHDPPPPDPRLGCVV